MEKHPPYLVARIDENALLLSFERVQTEISDTRLKYCFIKKILQMVRI